MCSENTLCMTFYSFIYVCFPKTCSAVVLSPVRVTGMCGVLCSGWMSFRCPVDWQCCSGTCVLLVFHPRHPGPGRGRRSLRLSLSPVRAPGPASVCPAPSHASPCVLHMYDYYASQVPGPLILGSTPPHPDTLPLCDMNVALHLPSHSSWHRGSVRIPLLFILCVYI